MECWDENVFKCSGSHDQDSVQAHMAKTLKNHLLRNQEADYLETWYTASGTHLQPNYSNDDTGLTLTIFMTWSNLFPNASASVKAYIAYSHVFPSCSNSAYPMHLGELYRTHGLLVYLLSKAGPLCRLHILLAVPLFHFFKISSLYPLQTVFVWGGLYCFHIVRTSVRSPPTFWFFSILKQQ